MVEAFFLKSVEVKGHMHILMSIYLVNVWCSNQTPVFIEA